MDIVFVFTSNLFFLWIIRNTFYWITVWQENEYRPDRFFASLRKIRHKKKLFYSLLEIFKWLLLFTYAFVIFDDNFFTPYRYIIIALYVLQTLLIGRELYLNLLKKPKLTLQVYFIIFLTLLSSFALFAFPLMEKYFWLLLIDLFVPFLVSFFVFLFLFPTEIYGDWKNDLALRKIRRHPELLVIGITGSSGKSITKDYIAHVLEKKFKVIKTDGHNNTMTGIGRTILKKLESDTEIFVAEMSAYQKGEIAFLCQFIHPRIGVLTAINNHYLSLFKSLENIQKTNYELVESLPKNGFCLFNGASKNTSALFKKSRKRKILYVSQHNGVSEKSMMKADISASVLAKAKLRSFVITLNGRDMQITLPPHHSIEYLLPAIYVADYLGMTEREIRKAVGTLR